MEAHGVRAQDEHLILTLNEWTNLESELGYLTISKEFCGGRLTKLGGPFRVGQVLLQQFETLGNMGHTFSNGDGQIILGEKNHFLTNQFLIACQVQLALDYIIIFIFKKSTRPISHLNLVDFSTRLVSVRH
jgi:hypothetical protein